ATSPKFIVTNNNDGTMTRFDFTNDDYTTAPTATMFASGGFRGDLTQVGADGCIYATQSQGGGGATTLDGARYDNTMVTTESSVVRICEPNGGGFAAPPTSGSGGTTGSISGTVFADNNFDRMFDAGDSVIPNVVVTLSGAASGSTATDANGNYKFAGLSAGHYTLAAPGTAANLLIETANPLSPTLTAGQNLGNQNFGYAPGSIAGFVYVDLNGNKMRDAGEPGIGGVVVTLGGPSSGNTVTKADGSYSFPGLVAGAFSVAAPSVAGGDALETPSPLGVSLSAGQNQPNVNFGYVPPPQPGLTIQKTPNPTTYAYAGQVIVYTYVVQNTGAVTLSGPFTIADDKLGSFQCGAGSTLAPGTSLSCTASYTIKASDLGNTPALPTGVVANVNTGAWLQGVMSTQDTFISGAGPGVPEGVYPGWCIEDHVPNDLHNQPGTLYSTIGGNLPADVANLPWPEINYVLNHKIRGAGRSDLQFFEDVQTAIWLLLGENNGPDFGVSAQAQQMVNEGLAHPTFVPGPGDVVAVIIHSDGLNFNPNGIQESILELKPFETIVNHAIVTAAFNGSPIQSGQVQATVTQVGAGAPIDATASADGSTARNTITTGQFSTTAGNELLLAFISADSVSSPNTTVTSVTGGGLTWQLVVRANAQLGTAEIWRAFATTPLSHVTVTAKLSQTVCSSLTVISLTGVDTTGTNGSGAIGATAKASSGA
ncbi:MAG TPA: SdrD B-like domain-containing protein, partial [Vicinamibacterales bacterium]|nr:SdrD B-like domain-containing protein [Vicinamibacterales bacterium]